MAEVNYNTWGKTRTESGRTRPDRGLPAAAWLFRLHAYFTARIHELGAGALLHKPCARSQQGPSQPASLSAAGGTAPLQTHEQHRLPQDARDDRALCSRAAIPQGFERAQAEHAEATPATAGASAEPNEMTAGRAQTARVPAVQGKPAAGNPGPDNRIVVRAARRARRPMTAPCPKQGPRSMRSIRVPGSKPGLPSPTLGTDLACQALGLS